jgi:hypothetical protein
MTIFIVVAVLVLMAWWEWRHGGKYFDALAPSTTLGPTFKPTLAHDCFK